MTERPFKSTLEAKFFYRSYLFEELTDLLTTQELPSALVLKGPEGAGKSTLLKRLPQATKTTTRMAPILNPSSQLGDILREALNFLGLGQKCPPSVREESMIGIFQNAVNEFMAEGLNVVLAIDDAQNLDLETTSDLLALATLEPDWIGRFCLLLAGPAENWPNRPIAGQVAEIAVPPLDMAQTIAYVLHRLRAAGATKHIFTAEALTSLQTYSNGLPSMMNVLAEKSLMTAWAAGKSLINQNHVIQAKGSLDNPLKIDVAAAKKASAGSRRERGRISNRSWLFILSAVLLVGSFAWLLWPDAPSSDLEPVQAEVVEDTPPPPGPDVTPAAPAGSSPLGLPTVPPALVKLPHTNMALVADLGQPMARLWQGGLRSPGLKAEIALPDFKEPGLYLVGRPRSSYPIIFQYPPAQDIPRAASEKLWTQVESMLPQDVLPLIVADGPTLAKKVDPKTLTRLNDLVRQWTESQRQKNSDEMASLYADTFSFYEPGRRPLSISRRNFRLALESETVSAGEVGLTISEPIILLDPRDHGRAWTVFNLKYDSKLRHDTGLRTLIFQKSPSQDEWRIVAELWLKKESLNN
ncbi:MAG: AAA family ATPase [Deltaproteobacteria bacterium]|nr:AAA family ATPase [Deltaproteobacteria bacterium]